MGLGSSLKKIGRKATKAVSKTTGIKSKHLDPLDIYDGQKEEGKRLSKQARARAKAAAARTTHRIQGRKVVSGSLPKKKKKKKKGLAAMVVKAVDNIENADYKSELY